MPSPVWANDASVADVLAEAEVAAVGASTPTDAQSPLLAAGDSGVHVDLDGGDMRIALGASHDAMVSASGPYATAKDSSITYAVSSPHDNTTRFSAILTDRGGQAPQWTWFT